MALQCYRKAVETDPRCVCALYQSMLIYRRLGNTQAEIQALRLLHSVSNTSIHHIQGRQKKMPNACKMCLNVCLGNVDKIFLLLKNTVCLCCSRIALSR